jgi:hypothetical protein
MIVSSDPTTPPGSDQETIDRDPTAMAGLHRVADLSSSPTAFAAGVAMVQDHADAFAPFRTLYDAGS